MRFGIYFTTVFPRGKESQGNYFLNKLETFEEVGDDFAKSQGIHVKLNTQFSLAAFALLCIFLGTLGTFWVRCDDRRQDIGVMRSLGASKATIIRQFFVETGLLVTLAFVCALPLLMHYVHESGMYYAIIEGEPKDSLTVWWLETVPHFCMVSLLTYAILLLIALLGTYIPVSRAAKVLPAGYGYEFGGMSREEADTGNSVAVIFGICILFIFLILCALYESIFIPVVIILSVPFGLAGSFLFARMFGLENNIYLQIGLLMLIGLLAKTAILLTEYASQKREEGMSISQAAMSAAKARLRPILMTSLTMIFGMLPLMFASGVGANGNISIGVGTVGGMLIGTIALIVIVPALFIVFQHIEEKVMPKRKIENEENYSYRLSGKR